ncbi:beta-L-arabinofuranosidase domain-containing protein [Mucilaginibacter humi]|uniref:beta-L-arabinofuranosidase domain-containing protein n=1 Tax=Mucilaginibacter humi TaxID=2732510 RepID=UPI001C2E85AF|nr:beta-L-arabinofuranosidase domain-containing protein [Mucilaginibacter humi]
MLRGVAGTVSYNRQKQISRSCWANRENIKNTEINIAGSGSAVECWFGGKSLQAMPVAHYRETCVTATWIKLSQQLLRLTGEAKYADAIEQSYYNALLGAMKSDGSDWAKYSPRRAKGWKVMNNAAWELIVA